MVDSPKLALGAQVGSALVVVLSMALCVALADRFTTGGVDLEAERDAQCRTWGAPFHTPEYAICHAVLARADRLGRGDP